MEDIDILAKRLIIWKKILRHSKELEDVLNHLEEHNRDQFEIVEDYPSRLGTSVPSEKKTWKIHIILKRN